MQAILKVECSKVVLENVLGSRESRELIFVYTKIVRKDRTGRCRSVSANMIAIAEGG